LCASEQSKEEKDGHASEFRVHRFFAFRFFAAFGRAAAVGCRRLLSGPLLSLCGRWAFVLPVEHYLVGPHVGTPDRQCVPPFVHADHPRHTHHRVKLRRRKIAGVRLPEDDNATPCLIGIDIYGEARTNATVLFGNYLPIQTKR
jgi:hypothetical protein